MTPPTATAIPETDSPERQQGNGTYGSDLMVDLLEAMGAEYVFINPGSSFRGIHDSLVNYHGNRAPEIVLATHEISFARRVADWVVFLAGGRVLESCEAPAFFQAPATAAAREYLGGLSKYR